MKILTSGQALENLRKNRFSRWCGDSEDEPGPAESAAAVRIGSVVADVHVRKKFDIKPDGSIFAMGSCFAREIELSFAREGFKILSFDEDLFASDLFRSSVATGSGSFLFRYTTASMRMEVARLLGELELPDDKLLIGSADALLDLNFGGMCERGDLTLIAARRRATLQLGRGLREADVVVLTLGLTEAWFDTESGLYINAAPDLPFLRRGGRFEMRSLGYNENLENMREVLTMIRRHNSRAKFVVTVSPVPLQATFSGDDVIVANMRSKSLLRAVAATLTEDDDSILYFPSFEMVLYSDPSVAWKGDRRHVTREMVRHIIGKFKKEHGLATTSRAKIALVELDRARVESNAGEGFSIQADEIFIHPQSGHTPSYAIFRNIAGRGLVGFRSNTQVTRAEAAPVRFSVAISSPGTRNDLRRADVVTKAGEVATLDLDLNGLQFEELDLVLMTEMADPKSPTNYAWSQFISPTLVYS